MKENVDASVYESDTSYLLISKRKMRYPINALLEGMLKEGDELKVILLLKRDEFGYSEKNKMDFIEEFSLARKVCQGKVEIVEVNTDFLQKREIYEQLVGLLVDEIADESHVLADITYGPKDLPILIFTVLQFAEKFLKCEIDGIFYGQASFFQGHAVNTKICDMSALYYLSSISNLIQCEDSEKARKMLKLLLAL